MCGIIGLTGASEQVVADALDLFKYRGPDATGFFVDDAIALGHRRLSIIDLDPRSSQPFFDESGDVCIVFNGEIYNFKELRDELVRVHGIKFRTTSDTEVLLYAHMTWGRDMLPRLRGMFAFAIYDKRDQSVFLARDHAGIKPLYWSSAGGRLAFASEIKGVVALLRSINEKIRLRDDALALYSVFGYVPTPLTLVDTIEKLPRASWLRYDIRSKTAESGEWHPAPTKEIHTVADVEDALRRSVVEHCIADVPVGLFFSGGIDSSLVAAILKDADIHLKTFSVRMEGRTADEPYFRDIAKHLDVEAHVVDFGLKEFEDSYDHVFDRIDDPIADTSLFPTSYISRIAAEHVKVVLSGEGGDELFLGYPRIRALKDMGMPQGEAFGMLDRTMFNTPSFKGKNLIVPRCAEVLKKPSLYYLTQTSLARDRGSVHGWRAAKELLLAKSSLWFDRDWYLENMLLRKADMATMYASIEGRVPLLGVEIWNAAPSFADENLKNSNTKGILKDMLAKSIPREFIDRPKAGFGTGGGILVRSKRLYADLAEGLPALREVVPWVQEKDARVLLDRNPAYAFGLVALYRALGNLAVL